MYICLTILRLSYEQKPNFGHLQIRFTYNSLKKWAHSGIYIIMYDCGLVVLAQMMWLFQHYVGTNVGCLSVQHSLLGNSSGCSVWFNLWLPSPQICLPGLDYHWSIHLCIAKSEIPMSKRQNKQAMTQTALIQVWPPVCLHDIWINLNKYLNAVLLMVFQRLYVHNYAFWSSDISVINKIKLRVGA